MQYMNLHPSEREALLASLEGMPAYLEHTLSGLTTEQARAPGPGSSFSAVEQVWHLADLEKEGFGWRIQKLLSEPEPFLPDFDGAAVAAQRNYRALSLTDGLSAFTDARQRNIVTLKVIAEGEWTRNGQQEGVGRISLCDIPSFMSQHDAAHRKEIEELRCALSSHT